MKGAVDAKANHTAQAAAKTTGTTGETKQASDKPDVRQPRQEEKVHVRMGDRVFYRVSGRIFPAMVTKGDTARGGDSISLVFWDAECQSRSQGENRVLRGVTDKHWWHSLDELEAALALERKTG